MCAYSGIEADVAQAFGRKLREARATAKMTQERLGHLSSVDRSQIGRLEAGQRIPRLDTVVRLAGALDIEPCELIADIRWTPPSPTQGGYSPGS